MRNLRKRVNTSFRHIEYLKTYKMTPIFNESIDTLRQKIKAACMNNDKFVLISLNSWTFDLLLNQRNFPSELSNPIYTVDSRVLYLVLRVFRPNLDWTHIPGADVPLEMIIQGTGDFRILIVGGTCEANNGTVMRLRASGNFVIGDAREINSENLTAIGEQLSQKVSELEINLVILCLGQPKQEWLARDLQNHGVSIPILCLGAFTDFISGVKRRSPLIINRLGLEWLWRLVSEPQRLWKRYLYFSLRGLVAFIIVMRNKLNE